LIRSVARAVVIALAVTATPGAAQTVAPPGPWIVDIRAVTSSVPTDLTFYPAVDATVVPSRGFGLDVGGHIYLFTFGPSRVGVGANVVVIRSTATEPASGERDLPEERLSLNMRTVAPQVSFNFGSRDGWSYLSAGLGLASVTTRVEGTSTSERSSGQLRSINFGGGARWFLSPRLAFGFDVRAHKIAAARGDQPTPGVTAVAVSAGLSLR
jgi:hypothetical protein